jgi:photosystem II stability/assembly factor-like uncharacterized protein
MHATRQKWIRLARCEIVGAIFVLYASYLSQGQSVTSIAVNSRDHLFIVVSGDGVLRSTDSGASWRRANGGLDDSAVASLLTIDPSDRVLCATNHGLIFRSTSNGDSWALSSSGLPPNGGAYSVTSNSSGHLFLGNNLGLFRSTDSGGNWQKLSQGLTYDPAILSITAGGIAIGPTGPVRSIFRSTDNGENWNEVSKDRATYALTHDSANAVFAGTYQNGILFSTDNGLTWSAIGPSSSWVITLASAPRYVFAGDKNGYGVFRFLHNGDSLQQTISGLSNLTVNALAVTHAGTILAATQNGLFSSANNGTVWIPLTTPTFMTEENHLLPDEPRLEQNYPNPFNPTTVISYQLPVVSNARLGVYDLLGREVAVLVNERRNAGVHEVKFNASGFSSGVYFYRLTAGRFVHTRKLLLLR